VKVILTVAKRHAAVIAAAVIAVALAVAVTVMR
jgi:hypothetical protein